MHFFNVRDARGALSLDVGFDPFRSGGWGRCTKAKLADEGYVVDPVEARREQENRANEESRRREQEKQREYDRRRWMERTDVQIFTEATSIIGGGSKGMVQIGDYLAHVWSNSDDRCAVVEWTNGRWIAREPRTGEKLYR